MCCCLVRLLLVAMLATQHTDFESFPRRTAPPGRVTCQLLHSGENFQTDFGAAKE